MDPAAIASSWSDSIAAGRSRLYIAAVDEAIVGHAGLGPEERYGFTETADRTPSSLNNLPERRLSLAL